MEQSKPTETNDKSMLQKSSMLTYSLISCCICGVKTHPSPLNMCETCFKSNVDISDNITKEGIILYYCRLCERFQKGNNWYFIKHESPEMMSLCMSLMKGVDKHTKIIDSSFVWTEPHSKRIKVKLTIQKEVFNKVSVQKSIIIEFTEEWTQCADCKKSFTPHLWSASVQVRQKVSHKRTFLLLEQLIIKNHMHLNTLNVKEYNEGVDFYFKNKAHASTLKDFLVQNFPCKVKESKQVISHDAYSNIYNYKYTFVVEIAPVCKDDLIMLSKSVSKELGGIGPILLCHKLSSKIHLVDIKTFNTFEFDENTYFKHNFKSYIERERLVEFLIVNVNEEIDYKNKKINASSTMNHSDVKNITMHSRISMSNERNQFKIVDVECIFNNQKHEGNYNLISVKTHLGSKIKPGDIFYGYDLTSLNTNNFVDDVVNSTEFPDIILVKKKVVKHQKNRKWKLKHLEKENAVTGEGKSKTLKNNEAKEKDYEQFLEDIEEDKELRNKLNLYKDPNIENLEINENNNDDSFEIKDKELLDGLDLEPQINLNHEFVDEEFEENNEILKEIDKDDKSKNQKQARNIKKKKKTDKK